MSPSFRQTRGNAGILRAGCAASWPRVCSRALATPRAAEAAQPADRMSAVPMENLFEAIMNLSELASVLVTLGCPPHKSLEMAGQLDKRAKQLAAQMGKTHEEALAHLLHLMEQGWAAK